MQTHLEKGIEILKKRIAKIKATNTIVYTSRSTNTFKIASWSTPINSKQLEQLPVSTSTDLGVAVRHTYGNKGIVMRMLLKRGTCVLDVNTFLGSFCSRLAEAFLYSVELVCNMTKTRSFGCTTAYTIKLHYRLSRPKNARGPGCFLIHLPCN